MPSIRFLLSIVIEALNLVNRIAGGTPPMKCPICRKEHAGEEISPGAFSATHADCVRKVKRKPKARTDVRPADQETPKASKKSGTK
jgi:hypothetical protein